MLSIGQFISDEEGGKAIAFPPQVTITQQLFCQDIKVTKLKKYLAKLPLASSAANS
jgi:hypothetical protein